MDKTSEQTVQAFSILNSGEGAGDIVDSLGGIVLGFDTEDTSAPGEYRLNPYFPMTGLVGIAGDSEAHKSLILIALSLDISRGTPFLGTYETAQANVLYLDRDNTDTGHIKKRIIDICRGSGLERPPNNFTYEIFPKLDLRQESDLDKLDRRIEAGGFKVVDLDSLANFGLDVNDNFEVNKSLGKLKEIAVRRNCLFVLLLHENKNIPHWQVYVPSKKKVIGAVANVNNLDALIYAKKRSGNIIEIEHTKARYGPKQSSFRVALKSTERTLSLELITGKMAEEGQKLKHRPVTPAEIIEMEIQRQGNFDRDRLPDLHKSYRVSVRALEREVKEQKDKGRLIPQKVDGDPRRGRKKLLFFRPPEKGINSQINAHAA